MILSNNYISFIQKICIRYLILNIKKYFELFLSLNSFSIVFTLFFFIKYNSKYKHINKKDSVVSVLIMLLKIDFNY